MKYDIKIKKRASKALENLPDARATTIPIHGNAEIGGWLLKEILLLSN